MDNLIGNAVDLYIGQQNEEREPDGMWHPSSLSSPCVRRSVLEKQGHPFSAPPDAETKRIFMMGKIIHRLVQDAVAQDPNITLVIPEIEVLDEENEVTGQADILIFRKDRMEYELIEIKSIKQMGVRYGIPKAEHIIQAGTYAYTLREFGGKTEDGIVIPPLGRALRTLRFVYVEKETMVIHEKVVDAEDAAVKAQKRLQQLQRVEYEPFQELPVVGAGSWFRNYCPYRGSGMCCAD